ncbi:hypothetical protein MKW94_012355, partial [Papaver nudicaule]|nr:hypothetical protein [Papaver nudicaule]
MLLMAVAIIFVVSVHQLLIVFSVPVHRLPHEGEGVAMDENSATTVLPSSYAAAVHPDVTTNVDKVLTVEDDALSTTSTIDYFYSEEEYPSENSGTDEEENKDEEEDNKDEEEDIDDIDIEEDEEEDIDDIDIEDEVEDIDDIDIEHEEEDTDTWVIAPGAWKEATEGVSKPLIKHSIEV